MTRAQRTDERADEKLAALGRLVGGFAHEIKNPLSTIGLSLRLMEEELKEAQSVRERRLLQRTQRLAGEVERVTGILQDFLGYVRAPEPTLVSTSLNAIVRDVGELLAPEFDQASIRLHMLLAEGLPQATVDPQLVHQVLLNLLRNAEQAIGEGDGGGEILVQTSYDEGVDPPVHEIMVTDSGPGMSAEQIEACFQPYFSTKRHGTGLGLAISRRFVEDHGGEILVDSEPRGRYALSCSLAAPRARSDQERNERPTRRRQGCEWSGRVTHRVLIVDDDRAHAEVIGEALAMRDIAATVAETGAEGLRQLREGPEFAVVLTDLVMRDHDGFEILRAARERDASTKVLMLTGHGNREVAVQAMQDGAIYYLEKPVDIDELRTKVDKALDAYAREREYRGAQARHLDRPRDRGDRWALTADRAPHRGHQPGRVDAGLGPDSRRVGHG